MLGTNLSILNITDGILINKIQLIPIEGWYFWFCLGNLIADMAIAFFAIRVGYIETNLNKLAERSKLLKQLHLKSYNLNESEQELVYGISQKGSTRAISAPRKVMINELLDKHLDDNFLNKLIENISPNDMQELISIEGIKDIPSDKIKPNNLRNRIYNNRGKLETISEQAMKDYQKERNKFFIKYILDYKAILLFFFIGIGIQIGSLIGSWIF